VTKVEWESPTVAHVSLDNDTGSRDFILDYQLAGKEIQRTSDLRRPKGKLLSTYGSCRFYTGCHGGNTPARIHLCCRRPGSMYGFPLIQPNSFCGI
jgi:hypothetical protein